MACSRNLLRYSIHQLSIINTYQSYYQFIRFILSNFILKLFRHFIHICAISRDKHRMSNVIIDFKDRFSQLFKINLLLTGTPKQ